MKYYKAFDKDLKCRNMQYEIGKEYVFDGKPIPCVQGFHFCKNIVDVYRFYPMLEDTRVCEVKPLGEIATDDEIKFCTNRLKIVKEIINPKLKTNVSDNSIGFCNSGSYNSGDFNTGSRNSGSFNSGCHNSGDYNSGNWSIGVFNTEKEPKIKMFDKETDWTIMDWKRSKAYGIMMCCPISYTTFIREAEMTDKEKEEHPEYKTVGGYLKFLAVTVKDRQEWWDNLSNNDKEVIYNLPNFDAEKFKKCTGIEVCKDDDKEV